MLFYVDLGAHEGLTIDAWLAKNHNTVVLGVEANPELGKALRKKYKGDPRVTIVTAAAGIANGTATFYPGKRSSESGTLVLGKPADYKYSVRYDKGQPVPVVDTAELILEHFPKGAPAIIKIDIEAGEYELIPHLIHRGVLQRFREARVEWHHHKFGIPQKTHDTVYAQLAAVTKVVHWK